MRATGRMTYKMVKVWRLGKMAPNTKVGTREARSTVMENTSGLMLQVMKATGLRIRSTVRDSIFGQMVESTTVNGKITTCTARVFVLGKMAESMMENIKTTGSTAKVFTPGMTASNTMASGIMESNMVRACTERMVVIGEVSGKTVKESNGLMMPSKYKSEKF